MYNTWKCPFSWQSVQMAPFNTVDFILYESVQLLWGKDTYVYAVILITGNEGHFCKLHLSVTTIQRLCIAVTAHVLMVLLFYTSSVNKY